MGFDVVNYSPVGEVDSQRLVHLFLPKNFADLKTETVNLALITQLGYTVLDASIFKVYRRDLESRSVTDLLSSLFSLSLEQVNLMSIALDAQVSKSSKTRDLFFKFLQLQETELDPQKCQQYSLEYIQEVAPWIALHRIKVNILQNDKGEDVSGSIAVELPAIEEHERPIACLKFLIKNLLST